MGWTKDYSIIWNDNPSAIWTVEVIEFYYHLDITSWDEAPAIQYITLYMWNMVITRLNYSTAYLYINVHYSDWLVVIGFHMFVFPQDFGIDIPHKEYLYSIHYYFRSVTALTYIQSKSNPNQHIMREMWNAIHIYYE